jgi:hypothetical protein
MVNMVNSRGIWEGEKGCHMRKDVSTQLFSQTPEVGEILE